MKNDQTLYSHLINASNLPCYIILRCGKKYGDPSSVNLDVRSAPMVKHHHDHNLKPIASSHHFQKGTIFFVLEAAIDRQSTKYRVGKDLFWLKVVSSGYGGIFWTCTHKILDTRWWFFEILTPESDINYGVS